MSFLTNILLSFDSPKESNKEKATTKPNLQLSFFTQKSYTSLPRNWRFALFVDINRTNTNV
jgi:hypothetical protein